MPSTSTSIRKRQAAGIAAQYFETNVVAVHHFTTGLCHHVFDAAAVDGRHVVVRMGGDDSLDLLHSYVYWHPQLRRLGVPVPALLGHNFSAEQPYILLERLPGRDLGDVYPKLSMAQKTEVCTAVVAAQAAVGQLPQGRGFGFARAADDPLPARQQSWLDVLDRSLTRSRTRIERAGLAPLSLIDDVTTFLSRDETYFRAVPPTPFLDDTTTKNVIVHQGRLSGIVDTDLICYGDPLFTVGLTHMALLSNGVDTVYTNIWCDLLQLNTMQRHVVRAYTALFCLDFISEMGQQFNHFIEPDHQRLTHLIEILASLMTPQTIDR